MRVNTYVQCQDFPCRDVRHAGYQVPGIDLRPEQVSILLISEAAPAIPGDGYYAGAGALFEQTTVQAYLLIPLIPRPLLPPGRRGVRPPPGESYPLWRAPLSPSMGERASASDFLARGIGDGLLIGLRSND